MRKILFILGVVACLLTGCAKEYNGDEVKIVNKDHYYVVVIDSCEYVRVGSHRSATMAHKGNCKFCAERRKKEYAEVVDSLFMMQE